MNNISNFYKNKKVLITGVTGFKGAWLAKWLLLLGANVHGLGFNKKKRKKLFYELNLEKKIYLKFIDIRDIKKLTNYINRIKPSIVFHLASQTLIHDSYKFPQQTFDINCTGSLNILEITRKSKFIKSLIITTSDKCYESKKGSKGFKEIDRLGGIDPYSASKVSVEIMLRAYQKSFFKKKKVGASSVRSGNVIGGGDWSAKRLVPDCIRSLRENKTIFLRNPNFNRPWQFVLEPLRGYLVLAKEQFKNSKKYSSAWNFGTKPNTVTNVKTIVNHLVKFWGTGNIKIGKNIFYEQMNLQLNIDKAKKFLGWEPAYSIKHSIKLTEEWYKRVAIKKEDPIKVTEDQIKEYMNDSKIN